jgi:uncharacterized membrane protein (UPF0136 family)
MPPAASVMYAFAAGCALAYGLFTIAGGVMGYVRKGSKLSLIAGGASGLLLLVCAAGDWYGAWYAAAGAIVLGVLLAGRFVGTFIRERALSIGRKLSTLGIVALGMIIGGAAVAVVHVVALIMQFAV